jgi:hypothetical protein
MRTNPLLLAICFVLAIALVVSVVAPFQPPQHEQQQNYAEQQSKEKAAEHKPSKSLWERTHEDAVAFYTFILSCFTGLLVAVSGIQGYFLLRADKTARTAADAAKRTAQAAVDANRPWLNIKRIQFVKPLAINERGVHSNVEVQIENVGRSPAIDVAAWTELFPIVSGAKLEEWQIRIGAEAAKCHVGKWPGNAIFPNQTVTQNHPFSISRDEFLRGGHKWKGIDIALLNIAVYVGYRIDQSAEVKRN